MSQSRKVLIIGGTGFVGNTLVHALKSHFEVHFSSRIRGAKVIGATSHLLKSLTDPDAIEELAQAIEPEFIIFAAGDSDPRLADKDPKHSLTIHSAGATLCLTAAERVKARFIYISSCDVFSGTTGNYDPSETAIAFSNLGKSKLAAETYIRARSMNYLIFRCAPLMGRGSIYHPSWIDQIRKKLALEQEVSHRGRIFYNPTHISALTQAILKSIELDTQNKVIHIGGLSKVSMFEISRLFAENIGIDPDLIDEEDEGAMSNPIDLSLNLTETMNLLELKPLLFEQSFDLLKKNFL